MTHNDIKAKLIAEYRQQFQGDFRLNSEIADCWTGRDELEAFLSRAIDEAARAAGEASRVDESYPEREQAYAGNNPIVVEYQERVGWNNAIAQSSHQLAEHFGELEANK